MELRLNVLFLSLLALSVLGMTATDPSAALDPSARATRRLRVLEDACARAPADVSSLRALVRAYVDEGCPALAAPAVARAGADARRDALVLHGYARAEESLGRYESASALATDAVSACRADASCGARDRIVLGIHADALARIVALPTESRSDAERERAYEKAMRMASLGAGRPR